jgi:ribonuclease P protein subunit POP4
MINMISPENIVRHELVGLAVEVVESSNPSQKGIRGEVSDESRNMLTIETEQGPRSVAKGDCVFVFTLPGGERVRVKGALLVARPEDRVKKKHPRW